MGLGVAAAAAGAMIGGALGLTKAKLNVYKPLVPPAADTKAKVEPSGPPEKTYEFDYNPDTLTFTSKLETHETGNAAAGGASQPGAAKPATTTFNLLYSIFEIGDLLAPKLKINDLTKLKDELLALTQPHKATVDVKDKPPHPPLVDFSWGDLITIPALVTDVEVVYTHMLPNGTPVRMTAKIVLQTIWKEKKGTNPTSGGRTNRKTHTLLAGETLAGVAYAEYNDAALWRAIAEENEIDDPMRLSAGSVLMLPSFEA
jgi:nucleoid-associated protein YgaU